MEGEQGKGVEGIYRKVIIRLGRVIQADLRGAAAGRGLMGRKWT